MANGLQWIIREAKHLRRKDRNRREWRDYIKQASAIYAQKHKGRSPVGKPRKKTRRRRVVVRTKKVVRRRRVRGVSTRSKSHVDKNRITANIQVGSMSAHNAYMIARLKQRNGELAAIEAGLHRLRTKLRTERGDKYMNKSRRDQIKNYANYKRELKREITSLKRLIK